MADQTWIDMTIKAVVPDDRVNEIVSAIPSRVVYSGSITRSDVLTIDLELASITIEQGHRILNVIAGEQSNG